MGGSISAEILIALIPDNTCIWNTFNSICMCIFGSSLYNSDWSWNKQLVSCSVIVTHHRYMLIQRMLIWVDNALHLHENIHCLENFLSGPGRCFIYAWTSEHQLRSPRHVFTDCKKSRGLDRMYYTWTVVDNEITGGIDYPFEVVNSNVGKQQVPPAWQRLCSFLVLATVLEPR